MLALLGLFVILAILLGYTAGFLAFGTPDRASAGTAFEIGSAAAWILGSIGARPRFSNPANAIAAWCAAVAAGYFIGPNDLCTVSNHGNLFGLICELTGH
jgi:hypothetical protein